MSSLWFMSHILVKLKTCAERETELKALRMADGDEGGRSLKKVVRLERYILN